MDVPVVVMTVMVMMVTMAMMVMMTMTVMPTMTVTMAASRTCDRRHRGHRTNYHKGQQQTFHLSTPFSDWDKLSCDRTREILCSLHAKCLFCK